MPTPQKVRWSQLKVGVTAVAAMLILAVLIFLLTGSNPLFTKDAELYTFFDDSAALASGAPVRLNGILVGSVNRLELSGDPDPRRTIRVSLRVYQDRLKAIPVDSIASISAENVLGTKFINIRRGRSGQSIQPGGTIAALDTREFDEVVQSGYALLTSAQGIIGRVDKLLSLVESGQGNIGKFLVDEELYRRMVGTVSEVQKLTVALNSDRGTLGKLLYDPSLYNQVQGTITRVDNVIAGVERGEGSAGKLLKDPALYNEVQASVVQIRTMLADLNAGKGTAGKLLKDEALHNQIQATIARLDDMLARINAGQGTIGQLLVNQQLYDNLNGSTAELQGLMKDFRANPKKFLRIKLALF